MHLFANKSKWADKFISYIRLYKKRSDLKNLEDGFKHIQEVFPEFKVCMVHGKMKPAEKDAEMQKFVSGEAHIMVATTVIEVGVNVPNASVMIIENAERFGLAQLHQLRGRVGRGQYESYCVLTGNAKTDNTKRRMEIMTESTDGFYISEQDLKLRGSGELFGLKQSGDEGFVLANLYDDVKILRCAREEGKMLLESEDPNKVKLCRDIAYSLERWSKYICFN